MSPVEQLHAWKDAAPGFWARQVKHLGQLRHVGTAPRRVSFVFGCQRSGTKMVMRILDNSPGVRIYHENHASAFSDFELRGDRVIQALIAASPAQVQVFKPICDSHRADDVLDRHPGSRALWIYRDPHDVACSAVEKWGSHQREVIDALVTGDLATWGWRTADVPDAAKAAISAAWRPDLTDHEGALLFWYLRNQFFFSRGLDRDPRVRLVRYADLVQTPEQTFAEAFTHLGATLSADWVERVRASSVGRATPQGSEAVQALCGSLLDRLDGTTPHPVPLVSPVLVLIDTLGTGGAERYVVTVANWLHERGVAVTVASSGGELVPDLHPGVRHVLSPLRHVRAPGLPEAIQSVRETIRACQPRAIIGNSLAVTLIARGAQLRRTVPIINVAHGWPEDRYKRVAPLMRVADRVVAVSPDVKRKLVKGGLDAPRCAVVFNGVDCRPLGRRAGATRAAARAALGAGPDHLAVAIVGRLEDQKAHQHVITIASMLRDRVPRLRFGIVGDGSRGDELAALIDQHGVGDRVTLVGRRGDVPDLLGSADLYLNCSDWEGMPLTTIEAMASELPVVATRTEGSDQLLTPETGVVVPVADPAAMAAALERLALDDDGRTQMGVAARARALADFSHERMVQQLADVVAAAAWQLPEVADPAEEGP
jgi:glycosyltransferase involved in cell wall biosynthesis